MTTLTSDPVGRHRREREEVINQLPQVIRPSRPVALMVWTRDPSGRSCGRKNVLATGARSLEALGFEVEIAALCRQLAAPAWSGRRVHHVRLPGLPRAALSGARTLMTRQGSLNQSLFDSPRVRREVATLAWRLNAQVVVADGLRTLGPAVGTELPVLVHLDDLLSDRYEALASGSGQDAENVLGFFADELPKALRPLADAGARRLVRLESRLVRRLENGLETGVVAVTSPQDAEELSRRTGRTVRALSMAVDLRAEGDPGRAPATSFVYLGSPDYFHNLADVRWWVREVRPVLDRLGGADVHLTVVGHDDGDQERVLGDERLHFKGYVDDLGTELRSHRAMIAPVTSGTGINTKVLDAFSVGLPVVTTRIGAAGLGVTGDRQLLAADSAEDFARAMLRLRDEPATAVRLGTAGRELLARNWSSEGLTVQWQQALRPIVALPRELVG